MKSIFVTLLCLLFISTVIYLTLFGADTNHVLDKESIHESSSENSYQDVLAIETGTVEDLLIYDGSIDNEEIEATTDTTLSSENLEQDIEPIYENEPYVEPPPSRSDMRMVDFLKSIEGGERIIFAIKNTDPFHLINYMRKKICHISNMCRGLIEELTPEINQLWSIEMEEVLAYIIQEYIADSNFELSNITCHLLTCEVLLEYNLSNNLGYNQNDIQHKISIEIFGLINSLKSNSYLDLDPPHSIYQTQLFMTKNTAEKYNYYQYFVLAFSKESVDNYVR